MKGMVRRHRARVFFSLAALAITVLVGCVELQPNDAPTLEQSGLTSGKIPTFHEVEPILRERCTPCHVGEALNDCPSTCLASFYEALHARHTCCEAPYTVYEGPPEDCEDDGVGMTIGECGLLRVLQFGGDGKDPVPPDQLTIFQTWIEHGMPE
jgi:hypothetical protein